MIQRTPSSEKYKREYYTDWCRTHDDFLASGIPSGYPRALAYLDPTPGDRILDIGCGRGEIVRQCVELGASAVGLDYSQAAVEIARRDGTRDTVRAGATGIPFPACSFDKILFMEILEHLDDSDLATALDEIKRVLRPGGRMVGSTPNRWGAALPKLAKVAGLLGLKAELATRDDPFHINVKNPFSLQRKLKRSGFKVRLYLGQDYALYPFHVPTWKRLASRLLFFTLHIWWIAEEPCEGQAKVP
ncbi:class I SAM-dependent methyltransferase [Chloroflexota bacterium]